MRTIGAYVDYFIDNITVVGTIVALFYALAIVCAFREVMHSRTSQGSIAWIATLLLIPFPTTFLYLVFGWKLFDDYADLRTQNQSGRRRRAARAQELAIIDLESTHDWPVQVKVAQLPFFDGNEAELLIDGKDTFASIFDGISRAEHYVLVQFYTVRDDSLGQELARRLIERARAGVKVYLLYDDVGSNKLPRRFVQDLIKEGVKASSFNHRHRFLRLYGPTRINYRSHRKIVVVDGTEAWVGGHNVGVEYLGENKRFGHWRDTHVHLAGPAALGCFMVFREDWHWATGEQLPAIMPKDIPTPGDQSILVMPTGPADKLEACAIAFSDVISRARERLWIVSPYFVPGEDMQTALYAAAMRGVDVRILMPEKPDHLMVWLASRAHAAAMVDHDIAIYRYRKGFLHEKIILVDSEIAGVGTVNFDNRSFNINFEVTLWFTHETMIHDVETMLTADFRGAHRVTSEEIAKTPLPMRFISQAARLLSPIL